MHQSNISEYLESLSITSMAAFYNLSFKDAYRLYKECQRIYFGRFTSYINDSICEEEMISKQFEKYFKSKVS